jgi:aryl-alcohol dehydrogenase
MKTTTIAAVVHEKDAPFVLEEVELDEPRANEVLVRMVATGLCHTDLSVRSGVIPFPLPAVLGHEGAGIVERVGSAVQRVRPGDHVLASFTSCGACVNCVTGSPSNCDHFFPMNLLGGTRLDGSHTIHQKGLPLNAHFFGQSTLAEHALIDERSLVRVDESAPLALLAPLGCGIQTGAGAVLNVLRPEPGSTVVVFGVGAVGLSAVMAAALTGAAHIVAVDVVPSRLQLAKELGATDTIDARSVDVKGALMEMSGGRGVDYTIESSGNLEAASNAVQLLAARGTCALIGAPPAGATVPVDVIFMHLGRKVVGVAEGNSVPEVFLPALVRLHELGKLPLERLVRQYPFAQIEQAAADAKAGVTIKPVLVFD